MTINTTYYTFNFLAFFTMKRNLFLSMCAASALVLTTSCSSDEPIVNTTDGDEVSVSFDIATEDAAFSRAISDGNTATNLYYRVFNANGETITGQDRNTATLTNGKGKVTLTLAKGQTYKIAFWAQSGNAPYVVADNMTVNLYGNGINTTAMEDLDAFCETIEFACTETGAQTVTLTRPFAQVNVGTTAADWEAAAKSGFTPQAYTVKFTSVATSYNVLNEVAEGDGREVIFSGFATPNYNNDVLTLKDGSEYRYIATSYVLPASTEARANTDAEFTFTGTAEPIVLNQGVSNLPVQANWRTNIVGQILTGTTDFNIVIEPTYDNDNETIYIWDGITEVAPAVVEGVYQITTPAEWAWLTKRVQYTTKFAVLKDLDFGGHNVYNLAGMTGVVDFGGKTFKNMVIVPAPGQGGYSLGFISGDRSNASGIKNLTLENVTVENKNGGYAGVLFGDVQNDMTIENVVISGSSAKGVQSVGGLIGFLAEGKTLTLKNVTVDGCNISNVAVDNESGNTAALVGRPLGTINAENVVVTNNVINAFYAARRGEASIQAVLGNISDITSYGITASGNSVTKTPLTEADVKISTAAELVAFAKSVKEGNSYENKTVALVSDIDLDGVAFEPIGGYTWNTSFKGEFDGHGYTIKNMTITDQEKHYRANGELEKNHGAGFFANLSSGSYVKNLNFDNAKVTGTHWVGVICGYHEFGVIENCTVNNSRVEAKGLIENGALVDGYDGDKAGGLVGIVGPNIGAGIYAPQLKDCKVTNSQIYAARDAGKGVGLCNLDHETADLKYIVNCSAENTSVQANGQGSGANIGAWLDGFVGRK